MLELERRVRRIDPIGSVVLERRRLNQSRYGFDRESP
jgi:hypothetical protein